YNLQKTQLIGAPGWLDDRYDIEGVPDTPGKPTFRQVKIMLQKLLADRFALKFHHDQRDLSIYALTLAKGGPKLTANTTGPEGQPDESSSADGAQRSMKFSNSTMADLTLEMEFYVGKPIVDQTGLTGRYNFTLIWTKDDDPQQAPNAAPGLFTAIQEQLGLKLEAKKGPADVLVIDHIDRPSAN
ncbi:MAG TPA: TIGR03435 family protein, partial [Acidobacteriaceae bacterium]|nr:TIGR03435 family protein [Acidobacteriaceae bacterium]